MRYLVLSGFIAALSIARGNGLTLLSSSQSIIGTWSEQWTKNDDPNVGGEMDGVWGTTGNALAPISDSVYSQPFYFSQESATLAPLSHVIDGYADPGGIVLTADPYGPSIVNGITSLEAKTTTTFAAFGTHLFINFSETGFTQFPGDFSGTATLTDLTTSTTLFSIFETLGDGPIDQDFVFNSDPSHLYQLDFHEFLYSYDDSFSNLVMQTTLNSAPDKAPTLALLAVSCLGLVALGRRQLGVISNEALPRPRLPNR